MNILIFLIIAYIIYRIGKWVYWHKLYDPIGKARRIIAKTEKEFDEYNQIKNTTPKSNI